MTTPPIEHSNVKKALDYNPQTGVFVWLINANGRAPLGSVAGCKDNRKGYVLIRLHGTLYLAHRLAWFHMTGEWPKNEIDHIDGNTSNNAFSNLRDVSTSINQQNLKRAKTSNKTGYLGVSRARGQEKFIAFITTKGKTRRIGQFDTPELAHAAYIAAKRKHHIGNTI